MGAPWVAVGMQLADRALPLVLQQRLPHRYPFWEM